MKFSFKRILSSALAAVMAASVMSVGMVSSVSAAEPTVLFDGKNDTAVYGSGVTTNPADSGDSKSTQSGDAFTRRIKLGKGNEDTDFIKFSFEGSFTLDFAYRAGGKDRTLLLKKSTGSAYETVGEAIALTYDSANKNYVYYGQVEVTGTTGVSADYMLTSATENSIYYLTATSSAQQDTYTITGNVTGLAANDTFTLGDYEATVVNGTYTVTKSVAQGTAAPFNANDKLVASKANYKVTSPADATVTLSGSDKTFTATPDLVFAESLTYQTAIPTDTGYTFTGEGRLPLEADAEGGAYAKEDSASNDNHIQISGNKALLVDKGPGTTTMYLPLTEKIANTNTGKVTISGPLSDFANIGSKWNVLNFENSGKQSIVGLRLLGNDNNPDQPDKPSDTGTKYFSLAFDSGKVDSSSKTLYNYYPTNVECKNNGSYTYSVTFDYDAKTVTLDVDGKSVTVNSTQEASLATMGGVGTIVAMTAGSNARQFALGNITISVEGAAATIAESAKPTLGGDYYAPAGNDTYIIHPVSQTEMSNSSLSLDNTSITTNTVYDSVKFSDNSVLEASQVDGAYKIFAILVQETNGEAPSSALKWVLQ